MLVSAFMVPAEKAIHCFEDDSLEKVVKDLVESHVSAVVVVDKENNKKAVGIFTKTDVCVAFDKNLARDTPVGSIMAKDIKTVPLTMNRDDLAKMLEHNRFHHAIVLNDAGEFAGMVSSYDVALEVAKDARAWPYSRTPDGRIH
jgi:CBS domain-containing protein